MISRMLHRRRGNYTDTSTKSKDEVSNLVVGLSLNEVATI